MDERQEKFSLTDQIRRYSRSVYTNLAEAWRKGMYQAVFINKLKDAKKEAAETQTWLENLHCHVNIPISQYLKYSRPSLIVNKEK